MSLGNLFGLLPSGFSPKQQADIQADLTAAQQAAFGASINVTPQSRFGQIIGIMSERFLELWNLAQTTYAAFDPDSATGAGLVALAALTGTLPVVPTSSAVTVTATGTPTTVLPLGQVVQVTGTHSLFSTSAGGTITAVPAYAGSTVYALANRVTSGGKVWQCSHPGTSSTPPTGAQGSTFTDGALTWLCLGSGTGAIDIAAASNLTGQIVAAAGSLISIQTPVAGWSSVYNVGPAILGVAAESDSAFRIRREAELRGIGKSAVEAIRAALLKLAGVTAAIVFENVTEVTNSDGMPPHTVEAMVQGGDPTVITTALFQTVAAGIGTTGNQTPVTITDSQGITHSVLYSRPGLIGIWITVNVIVDPSVFPSNGAAQIISNLVEYGSTLAVDYDVFSSQLAAAILNGVPSLGIAGIPGVLDPGLPLIGLSNPPTVPTTLSITSRQLAVISAGQIVVNVSNGTP